MKNYGIEVRPIYETLGFQYGRDIVGPEAEIRTLEDIRQSLLDPNSIGPEKCYGIAMDVYREKDKRLLEERNLLFGIVNYSKGQIGQEPVRSQGHIHAVSKSCNASTCEVYEIWEGEAFIYIQESGSKDAGICHAVHAKAGDVVVVPPGFVHATINADVNTNMTFGAWCVRDYGFDYDEVREHNGIAFFPKVQEDEITWNHNEKYSTGELHVVEARTYPELGIEEGIPIYQQFIKNPDRFLFVPRPRLADQVWEGELKHGY